MKFEPKTYFTGLRVAGISSTILLLLVVLLFGWEFFQQTKDSKGQGVSDVKITYRITNNWDKKRGAAVIAVPLFLSQFPLVSLRKNIPQSNKQVMRKIRQMPVVFTQYPVTFLPGPLLMLLRCASHPEPGHYHMRITILLRAMPST